MNAPQITFSAFHGQPASERTRQMQLTYRSEFSFLIGELALTQFVP